MHRTNSNQVSWSETSGSTMGIAYIQECDRNQENDLEASSAVIGLSYMKKSDSNQENGPQEMNPPVGLAYMNTVEKIDENVLHERKKGVGFFKRLETTGLIPYLVVPSHNKSIKEDIYIRSYWTRWYVLFICAWIFFFINLIWGTFTPISEAMRISYTSWTDQTIAGFTLFSEMIIFIACLLMMMVSQALGLRSAILMSGVIGASSATLRFLTLSEWEFTFFSQVCSVTNAFAMCIALSIPVKIAAAWFPEKERMVATAIANMASHVGPAGAYLAPLLVTVPEDLKEQNDIWKTRHEINLLMMIYAGILWVLTLLAFLYLPSRPPIPPTITSYGRPLTFVKGLKSIWRNKNAVLAVLVFSVSFAVPSRWIGVMNYTLEDMAFGQDEMMPIGCTAIITSGVASVIIGVVADQYLTHKRTTIICLLCLSSISFLILLLMQFRVMFPSFWYVLIAITCGRSFNCATVPLLMDMTMDISYPCSGEVVGAVLVMGSSGVSLIFTGALQIPVDRYLWITIALLISQCSMIVPLLLMQETSRRRLRDTFSLENEKMKKKKKSLLHTSSSKEYVNHSWLSKKFFLDK